jgi:hypothetical protein
MAAASAVIRMVGMASPRVWWATTAGWIAMGRGAVARAARPASPTPP